TAIERQYQATGAGLLAIASSLLPDGDVRRLDALRNRAQALWEAGGVGDAEETLLRLLTEAKAAGEARLVALAELERIVHEQLTGADSAAVQQAASRAIELCAAAGDEAGLAVAGRRRSSAHRRAGELAAGEVAAHEAIVHARAAGNRNEESRAIDSLCNCLFYGPTPVEAALATCAELLESAERSRSLEANVLGAVAGLEAMRSDFSAARTAYARAAAILEELGLELTRAALTQIGAPLELLAGDAVAAEREARRGAETFERFGSAGLQSPLIAEALEAQGRRDEAARELDGLSPSSGPELAQWQVRWHIVRSRLAG